MQKLTTSMHLQMLYPSVRVRTQKDGGSGTILFSGMNKEGEYETYVLTNHHVIAGCISIKKKWDHIIGKEIKKEVRCTVNVEIFQYKYDSHCIGSAAIESDIVAYDVDQDIALLKLRTVEEIGTKAKFIPVEHICNLKIFDDVFAVGASLGHAPIATRGMISYMDDEIDNYKYWMCTAQVIFGNSGGGIFTNINDEFYFIGIPSKSTIIGWSDTITHMGYFIPPYSIIAFLNKNHCEFIYDPNKSLDQCKTELAAELAQGRTLLEHEYGGAVTK